MACKRFDKGTRVPKRRPIPPQRPWFECWICLALLAVGCDSPVVTQALVAVNSDLPVGSVLQRVDVTVTDASGQHVTSQASFELADQQTPLPLSFGIRKQESGRFGLRVAAIGLRDGVERELVSQRSTGRFVQGQTSLFQVFLAAVCEGHGCAAEQTCYPVASESVAAGQCGRIRELPSRAVQPRHEHEAWRKDASVVPAIAVADGGMVDAAGLGSATAGARKPPGNASHAPTTEQEPSAADAGLARGDAGRALDADGAVKEPPPSGTEPSTSSQPERMDKPIEALLGTYQVVLQGDAGVDGRSDERFEWPAQLRLAPARRGVLRWPSQANWPASPAEAAYVVLDPLHIELESEVDSAHGALSIRSESGLSGAKATATYGVCDAAATGGWRCEPELSQPEPVPESVASNRVFFVDRAEASAAAVNVYASLLDANGQPGANIFGVHDPTVGVGYYAKFTFDPTDTQLELTVTENTVQGRLWGSGTVREGPGAKRAHFDARFEGSRP